MPRLPSPPFLGRYSTRTRTRLDGREARQEGDGVQDRFSPLEPSRPQNPGGDGVDDEGVEEEPTQPRQVVAPVPAGVAVGLLVAHVSFVSSLRRSLLPAAVPMSLRTAGLLSVEAVRRSRQEDGFCSFLASTGLSFLH